ncbi:hypothetical protein EMUCRT_0046 [Ehrlichia cf. muris str. EmCRT]|uniref:Uncharacterized protein n=1 Tax=Ehrlichia cf. muris str. EmCRT TaxID=1359167 RepID=A0A0F3NCU9_9RICK|nr:hypothetical protein EMUCRT_0046 [Ehrlichia cf. muris str. EmCRT]
MRGGAIINDNVLYVVVFELYDRYIKFQYIHLCNIEYWVIVSQLKYR